MIRPIGWLLATVAVTLSGCHLGVFAKREAELKSPTDIRQTIPWHAGEDAVFKGPVRPSCEYYGHRPTCWRSWPGSAEAWRDAYCPNGCTPGCEHAAYPVEAYANGIGPSDEVYSGEQDPTSASREEIPEAMKGADTTAEPLQPTDPVQDSAPAPMDETQPEPAPEDQASWEAPLPQVIRLQPPKQEGPLFQSKPSVAVIPPPPQF